jgi:tetratricopeptide (TPR) repeat protein
MSTRKMQILTICLCLTAITLIAFLQINQCDFVDFDDPEYVTYNVHIRHGISMEAIRWAFTTDYVGNWHPLTWMSHMLDVQLFGLNPRWHHLTNLLFHMANTLLLFFVFYRMTKSPWKSAFVAALFAIHPLHVESVAWVAERKDVLSTFFWMLTMWAYIHYVEHPKLGSYLAVVAFFALGLMAKPMVVTLPFVLLLLDYWPLRRLEQKEPARIIRTAAGKPVSDDKNNAESGREYTDESTAKRGKEAGHKRRWTLARSLLLEKIPLFTLAAFSGIVTLIAQAKGGGVASFGEIPLAVRIANAFVSYAFYVEKMFWPANLAVFYPYRHVMHLWQVLGAVIFFIAVSMTIMRTANKFPYLAVGWLWFAGTLVPIIGIVQVGGQAMADRYTYIPLVGLFVMAAWGIPDLLEKWFYRKEVLVATSALIFSFSLIVTWTQVGYWRNSIALYDHALEVTSHNVLIYYNRGTTYGKLGNHIKAIEDFNSAIEINPKYADAFSNRGSAYSLLGDQIHAIDDFNIAIKLYQSYAKLNPKLVNTYYNRGLVYSMLGNIEYAIIDFTNVINMNSKHADAFNDRGLSYSKIGNQTQAIEDFNMAIKINQSHMKAFYNRGVAYHKLGDQRRATEDMKTAARLGNEDAKNYLRSHGVNW